MYVGDTAGQIWRFDIHNGMTAAGTGADALVSGGVMASLGAHETHADADARRFYYQPSVSLMDTRGLAGTMNIAIGSGYRGHPLSKTINDRVYSIRDTQTFANLTQAQFDALYTTSPAAPIAESNLENVTTSANATIPSDKKGWLLKLATGEKVLSEVSTFDNDLFFVTYTPGDNTAVQTNACMTNTTGSGTNLSYAVNVVNASPISNLHTSPTDPDTLTTEDRSTDLKQGGIASGVTFLFPADDANTNSSHGRVVCLSGVEILGVCTNFNSRLKTYWRETDAP
jgi:type IV pilus assembly protein PilY1